MTVKINFVMHSIKSIELDAKNAVYDGRGISTCPHPRGSIAESIWMRAYKAAELVKQGTY